MQQEVGPTSRQKSASKKKARSSQPEVVIPDKLYFRIGEVARLTRLPSYVLRFWETEFPQLKPVKSGAGQRMYRRKDVESVLRIKTLLYDQGFTIAGARQQLRSEGPKPKAAALPFPGGVPVDSLKHVRQGLKEILNILATRHR